jgi:RNA polymerase sigma factor (sigma-70 family)
VNQEPTSQPLDPKTAEAGRLPAMQGSVERIYIEHALLLRRVAIRKFGIPKADAETLVHDVFAAYIANPGAVRTNLRSYLVAATCNACRNYWRSHRMYERFFVPSKGEEDEESRPPDETFFEGLALHLVISATLAKLGQRCRDILRRYYFEGEDTQSIAAALGTSPANVNYVMHVCRKKARHIYDEITRLR